MKRVIFYDIDETLVTHDPKHYPRVIATSKRDNSQKRVTSTEFHSFVNDKTHDFDFSEYRCAERFARSAIPVWSMINKVRSDKDRGETVELLTARGDLNDKSPVIALFKSYGINIDPALPNHIHLNRAGNYGLDCPAKNKYMHISDAIKKHGYNEIVMYDDNHRMKQVMEDISKEFNIPTTFHHMQPPYELGVYETYYYGVTKCQK